MAVSGRNLSSTMSRGSGEDFDLICQPCDRDDLRLQAFGFCRDCQEHFCESCYNHHKRAKPSRHHILLDKQHMPQTQQLATFVPPGQSDNLTKSCPKHTKEIIKFYCHKHRSLLCSVCVTLQHTHTACRISYIPDISEESLNSNEYRDVLNRMDTLTENCRKITADLKQMTAKSNTSLKDVLAEIKQFRHEMNQMMDELEKAVEDTVKVIRQENDKGLHAAETTFDNVIKSLKASSGAIRQLSTSHQADELFMELYYAEQLIKENEKRVSMLPSPDDLKEYYFQPNAAISTCLKNEKCLGTLIQKIAKPSITFPNSTLKSFQFTHQGDINVKTSLDQIKCWITGMAFIMPSKVILTDYQNMTIKMVDINSSSITDHLKLDTRPWGITTVTRDQLAATLPNKKTIQFLSVSSDQLSLKHTLKVNGECRGISCHKEKLLVTFESPPKLEIIDLTGKVITTFTKNSTGEDVFGWPYHVTSNSSAIYVADEGKSRVFMFNWRGDLTGSYDGVDVPRGITMIDDGSIFVSEYVKDNIFHISGDLTKGNVVLKDLKRPFAACWCGVYGQLYISCFKANDNCIQIFKKM